MKKHINAELPIKILVPSGSLGSGVLAEHVQYGIERGAIAIAVDAGSTDSGPFYLARATSKMIRESIKRDLSILMDAASRAKIPILVGSCGTSGTDAGVDWTCEIAVEIASELGIKPKIALLYSEQSPAEIKKRNDSRDIFPLVPAKPLENYVIDECDRIVALMGPEPYIQAILEGADIVLGGRTTDTAVLAAIPIMNGASKAHSWHAGKTSECGGQCTTNPRMGGVIFSVDDSGFEIEPLNVLNQCTEETVSAHMLYENSDPVVLTEPGGLLNVGSSVYRQVDSRKVRVTGSLWLPKPYTMKLEGAGTGQFQTLSFVGIQDPVVLSDLNLFQDVMMAALRARVDSVVGSEADGADLSLRIYGWNGLSGQALPSDASPPREVGVMLVVTAKTQQLASQIAKACNYTLFHTPLRPGMKLPSYAFPFSPAEIERGPVYEFKLNHIVKTKDPFDLVRTRWVSVMASKPTEVLNG
jgi:hypothetical protein